MKKMEYPYQTLAQQKKNDKPRNKKQKQKANG